MSLCGCGCGEPAPLAKYTDKRFGRIKGQPCHFIKGHQVKLLGKRFGGHNRTHGMSTGPEYKAWRHARARCAEDPRYTSRGIEFRFSNFEEFFAELGPRPTPAHSVDRKDNDGHYEPGNVRWATASEQNKNKQRIGAFTTAQLVKELEKRGVQCVL